MRSWFHKLLERWKSRNMKLARPACDHWASDDAFRRGRFMLGEETLTCERSPCARTNPLTLWRAAGFLGSQLEQINKR